MTLFYLSNRTQVETEDEIETYLGKQRVSPECVEPVSLRLILWDSRLEEYKERGKKPTL